MTIHEDERVFATGVEVGGAVLLDFVEGLFAVHGEGAEIRLDVKVALKKALKSSNVVEFIVDDEDLLRLQVLSVLLFDSFDLT